MRAYPLRVAAASVAATLAASSLALAKSAAIPSRPAQSERGQIAVYVSEASQRFGVPEAWIMAVMRVESAGDPTVTSSAGAIGLMQVMPVTYATLRVRLGLGANAYDPHDNIMAGAAYLREMHDRYGAIGFLAAYNAGPGRWEDHLAGVRPLPPETIRYMAQLAPMLGEHDTNAIALAISPAVATPEAAPIFVAPRSGSAKAVSMPATSAHVQLAAADIAGEPQDDRLFPVRQLAAEPSPNAHNASSDTTRFASRPSAPTVDARPTSLSPKLLFVSRIAPWEHRQ